MDIAEDILAQVEVCLATGTNYHHSLLPPSGRTSSSESRGRYLGSHSSRTYVRIRRMVLVSLCGVSDLFSLMLHYSNGVWLLEMIQLMLSDDSDNGAHDLIMRYHVRL
jgi:hypothetical protein